MVKILAFSGSIRSASWNTQLLKSTRELLHDKNIEINLVDLKDYPMPIYNGDDEAENGLPEHATRFKQLLIEHDGFLIASPEYNGSFSPLLKNVLDWASRSEEGVPPMAAYNSKVAALIAASPGRLGGIRGLSMIRQLLTNLGVTVLPKQHGLASASQAFDENGALVNQRDIDAITSIGILLSETVRKLQAT